MRPRHFFIPMIIGVGIASSAVAMVAVAAGLAPVQFQRNGHWYEARVSLQAKRPLQIYRNRHLITSYLFRKYHPWRLALANVTGNRKQYLVLGVTKATPNLPFPHRTLFVLDFDGHQIVRKWTGSTMGRPLHDFGFLAPTDNLAAVLVTLERSLDGQTVLAANHWNGFGFTKFGHEITCNQAVRLEVIKNRIILYFPNRHTSISLKELQ